MSGTGDVFVRGERFVFQHVIEQRRASSAPRRRLRRCAVIGALFLAVAPASGAAQGQGLMLTPTEETEFIGVVQGPCLPFQVPYTLHNDGTSTVPWVATATQPWVYLWEGSGSLAPGDDVTIPVSVDLAAANRLGAGAYHATLEVFDLSSGLSSHRGLSLTLVNSGPLLAVHPEAGFTSSGEAGGAFTPASQTYAIANVGTTEMDWSASTSAPWLTVSASSGRLQPGLLGSLVVGIDEAQTAALPPGSHSATFTLSNASNGLGSVSYGVSLEVSAATGSVLSVMPADDFVTSGPLGGPFLGVEVYELENQGATTLAWSASADAPWVRLTTASGLLDPGGKQDVAVFVDPQLGSQLGLGVYTASVLFSNDSGGTGSTTRAVVLTVEAPTTSLVVQPLSGFSSAGPPGGSFVPDQEVYTLANAGTAPLSWAAAANVPWVLLSTTSGTLDAGAQSSLMVEIDQTLAATLAPGSYSGTVFLANLSGGSGSTQRTVQLDVQLPASPLVIVPATGFTASGPPGGPFVPANQTYALRNQSSATVSWAAAVTASWLELSSYGGTLASGEETPLTVVIDRADTASLPGGVHEGYVVLGNLGGNLLPIFFKVSLSVSAPGGGTISASVSQFGITWTFDQPYPVGNFANGDWWVQGPVTIIDIDPPSIDFNGRVTNGSMINPDPRFQSQSYDSSMFAQYASGGSYEPEGNVALGVTPASPLLVQPHSSLVSSISRPPPGLRPQLQTAAILTVLPAPAPAGSFRPPYCGTDKTIEFNSSQLDWSKLASLHAVPSTPELDTVEKWFERPWLDHIPDWIGRYLHPTQNMPDYGREICDRIGTASLMLNLDFTPAEKEKLLVRLVQVGIDFYGVVEHGGRNNWPAGGGHHSGRKWPILFAGLMLNDPDMAGIGFDPGVAFNEDDQTFYVEETSPGVYNNGYGGYGPQHVGLSEWGNQHAKNLSQDTVEWFGNPYRVCCTANVWWGELLSAHIMGVRSLWNHQELFDYQDRYLETQELLGQPRWTIAWTVFPVDMWKRYRASY